MTKRKVGNRHDAMASQGKHMVKTNGHKKGLTMKMVKKTSGKKRGSKKTMLCG